MRLIPLLLIVLFIPLVSSQTYFYADERLIVSKDVDVKFHYENYLGSDSDVLLLPFGQIISGDARFAFTGKELDQQLYYFGARYYNPSLGRFSSIDPVMENHAYSYVDNNPLKYVDPFGEDKHLPQTWDYTVVGKDTSYSIVRHFGLTFKELQTANPEVDLGSINPGDNLQVPLKFDVFERFPALLEYKDAIIKHSKDNSVNPNLVGLIMYKETMGDTRFQKKRGLVENKYSGARGPMQIDRVTAEQLGVSYNRLLKDGVYGVEAGARYISWLKLKHLGDPGHIAAAYNWGPGKFINALETGKGATLADPVHGGKRPRRFDPSFDYRRHTPEETYKYVEFIQSNMR